MEKFIVLPPLLSILSYDKIEKNLESAEISAGLSYSEFFRTRS